MSASVESILANPESLLIAEQTKTYGTGRVCACDGCGTRLSMYNPDDYCDVHCDEQYDPRTVAMAYSPDGNRMCLRCGRYFAPTLRNWYADPKSKDGLSAECVWCMRPDRAEKEKARQSRANAKYKAKNPTANAEAKRRARARKAGAG